MGPWIQAHGGNIAGADIAAWPYSVGILFRFYVFSQYLALARLVLMTWAIFGFSFLELLILFEQWAGHPVAQ